MGSIAEKYGKGTKYTKKDILKLLDIIDRELTVTVLPQLKDLQNTLKGKLEIVTKDLTFSKLGFRDDSELFSAMYKVVSNYESNLKLLKKKIDDELPETIPVNSNNLNIKVAVSLVHLGLFFINSLPLMLTYLINKYYTKDKTNSNIYKGIPGIISTVSALLTDSKLDFKNIINTIGKFPKISEIIGEKSSGLPSTIIYNYFKKDLHISNPSVLKFLSKALNIFRKDTTKKAGVNKILREKIGTVGFLGNPIYHLRIFFADMEVNKLEAMKEKKRLLELKIAELKSRELNLPPEEREKIRRQIEYYENRIEQLDAKIEAILEDVDLRYKHY